MDGVPSQIIGLRVKFYSFLSLTFLFFLLFDAPARGQTTLLSASFDVDAGGFTYSDDTFRGTNQPLYASGNYDAAGGFSGGGLRVRVGGVNNTTINNMSGGWLDDFVVSQASLISITLRYRLIASKALENGECGQALLSIDGVLVSPGPNDFLRQFCGKNPNFANDQDSGWQQITVDVNLTAGNHTITVGGYNNQKTAQNESATIFFDDIEITQEVSTQTETICNDTIDNDGDGQTDCADADCSSAPNCNPEAICNDTMDNDEDGDTDCADTDCASAPNCNPETICDDSIDNDGDGQTDCADSDCAGDPNCIPSTETICDDSIDNDGDGQTDCADTDCSSAPNCSPETICDDTIDNDGDGQTDCEDSDCSSEPVCSSGGVQTLLSASFDVDAGGFTYSDDTFRGTNQPLYASGNYDAAGGFSGGGLRVRVGGVNNTTINNMSGGWLDDFVVSQASLISITLRYRLIASKALENGECGQALLSIDGVLVSPGPNDFLRQFCGKNPNFANDQDSGWQQITVDVNLTAGNHTITVGGYNNQKTAQNESATIFFDDIEITQEVSTQTETICNDTIDNDGDGQTDCADADCSSAPNCNPEAICNDTMDNDEDGDTDCADTDCASAPNCNPETICDDSIDNDGDGQTDCADSDCAGDPNCIPSTETICDDTIDNDGDGQTDCADADCSSAPNCNPETICDDSIDNDGDGQTDCADTDCSSAPNCNPETICDDSIDNDGDGQTDCADTDCSSAPNCNPETICDDSIDNDGDGQTDCADTDCSSAPNCSPETICDDSIDNDEDGDTDCADTDCASAANCNPEAICNDNIDNDGDGLTDCADTIDCSNDSACTAGEVILSAGFDTDAGGFTYSDDTFRGTNQPIYASGNYDAAGGFSGGGLRVFVGGVNNTTINNMSGGWSHDFMVSQAGLISVTLRYRLIVSNDYENGECGQALVSIDGILVSPGPNDFLQQFCGAIPNFPNDQDSGWQQANVILNLSAGTHTITVGGYNNKKTAGNENMNVYFDDIELSTFIPPSQETSCTDGVDNDVDGFIDCTDPDCSSEPNCAGGVIFSDDFNDGNANGWTVVNDGGPSDWQVSSGEYTQLNSSDVGGFTQSFLRGTYSYYNNGFALEDYEVSVDINSIDGGSIGIMFRYRNGGNYYRFSVSRSQGFSRLEKRVNGAFSTLASNGRGISLNQPHTITIDVEGPKILVYLDGEPLFSATDSSIGDGTVALFTQDNSTFDNLVIKQNNSTPKVIVSDPVSYSLWTTNILDVTAVARNVPPGGGLRFELDSGVSSFTDFTEPYSGQFFSLSQGDHSVQALIVDGSGQPIADPAAQDEDTNVVIGVEGNYFVAMGDSITNGVGDDSIVDDESLNGRNIGRGYTPILDDLLSGSLPNPITVANEGLGGTKSGNGQGNGVDRLNSTLARHPESQYWLILFGSNDSSGLLPSGIDCTDLQLQQDDPDCVGTYKDHMRTIILNLQNAGKVPLLSKVPFVINAPQSRDDLIQEYNIVLDQLVVEHDIPVTPPDFYTYFMNNQSEFADDSHPDGNGYISIADCWYAALCDSGILGIPEPCPPNPCDSP